MKSLLSFAFSLVTASVLAGTVPAPNYVGTFTGSDGVPMASLKDATNIAITAMGTVSIGPDQLDNQTWLSLLSQNYGSSRCVNRYDTSNTFYRVQHQMPITVLFLGDGLVDEPETNSIYQTTFQKMVDAFGLAGYIMMTPPGYAHQLFEPVSANYFGANSSFSKNADWLWGVYGTNDGSGMSYAMPATINADIYGVGWVSGPLGGNITLTTNDVTMTTLAGYSATRQGNWLWWTNTGHSTSMTIKLLNSGNGTNAIIGMAAIDSTAKGIIPIMQTAQSCNVSSYRLCAEDVRSPVYKAWAPDLVLCDYFIYTNNPTILSDFVTTLNWFKTNTPNADFVSCSSFNCAANYGFDTPTWANIVRTNAFAYFDGWGILNDPTTLVSRGFLNPDQAHLTSDGYGFWGASLWNWLGLNEKH